ncbi:MAG: MerR family transcriptional regulator [Gemmatimonadetes bacterium]|nr:MerR family transcriptional regulator [Gemmatimonadota bacterium]
MTRKEYYAIGEVAELLELKPHVLRYWETQFPWLRPPKNRSGNRVYRRKEIRLLLLLRRLLHEEKYTIEGARQKVEELRREGKLQQVAGAAMDGAMIELLHSELQRLLEVLEPPPAR